MLLDWIGSLRIQRSTRERLELRLSRSTQLAGWSVFGTCAAAAWLLLAVSPVLAAVAGLAALLGLVIATLRRTLVLDRNDGLLHIEQRIIGITSSAAVPLFHLRAVVLAAKPTSPVAPRFVAYIERRVGGVIHLDESRRTAPLLPIVEAIAEFAEIRLVYDISRRSMAN